jgi:hypothetical protein
MAVPPAHAKGGGATKPSPTHSWDGTCSVEGLVHFDPPATAFQQLLAVTYDATGTCTGRLDGRAVSGAPVEMHNFVHSNGSCLYAQTTGPGDGVLTFQDGPSLSYTFEFTYVGTDGAQTFRGQQSGSAIGHGSFLTPNSSPDAAAGCYNGEGVPELPMDISPLVTQSPLVSRSRPAH